jgi:hypothetical protein
MREYFSGVSIEILGGNDQTSSISKLESVVTMKSPRNKVYPFPEYSNLDEKINLKCKFPDKVLPNNEV